MSTSSHEPAADGGGEPPEDVVLADGTVLTGGTALAEAMLRVRTLVELLKYSGLQHVIGATLADSLDGESFEDLSPVDGSRVATVADGRAADVDRAVCAAAEAFDSWRGLPGRRRGETLSAVGAGIQRHARDIALLEAWETGQPLARVEASVRRAAEAFRACAGLAAALKEAGPPSSGSPSSCTLRTLLGPAGVLTSWQLSFESAARRIGAALAAGCTVVHKPSERAPACAQLLAQIALGAGLPPGVLNVVQGTQGQAGHALLSHPGLAVITVEGDLGTLDGAPVAPGLRRLQRTPDASSLVLILEDADLAGAVEAILATAGSGGTRVLVHQARADALAATLAGRLRQLRVGHPLDPQTQVGPLVDPLHCSAVLSCLEKAREDGGRIEVGGTASEGPGSGAYLAPTLITGLSADGGFWRSVPAGPIVAVMPFAGQDEALRLAAVIPGDIAASLWSADREQACWLCDRLAAWRITVNAPGQEPPGEAGHEGEDPLALYLESRHVVSA